jgi:hypothetical protein
MVKKKKTLDNWEWETLVAAWRYYEYGQTITSSSFPADIVKRFFTGKYDDESCKKIAYQFYCTDHGRNGAEDWKDLPEYDAFHWRTFYYFCKAWCNGFTYINLKDPNGRILEEVATFKDETTGDVFLLVNYLNNPTFPERISKACIVS